MQSRSFCYVHASKQAPSHNQSLHEEWKVVYEIFKGYRNDLSRDANHSDFCKSIPIFKANFHITILNVKFTSYNNLKMVPDKITGGTPSSTPVILDHR